MGELNFISKCIHFLSRKARLYFWRAVLARRRAIISASADISMAASIEPSVGSVSLASWVIIDKGVVIRSYQGNIFVGSYATLGPYCVLYGGGDLRIGSGVRIGPHVTIVAGNHVFNDRSKPIFLQGISTIGIEISDDVWVGAGAKILDGVTVGKGAVIAAGAVVTKSVPEWSIVAGVPARAIGVRGSNAKMEDLEQLQLH